MMTAAQPKQSPFDVMRRRVQQESAAQGQQAQDALRRRFAMSGMGASGAAIKESGKVADATLRATNDATAQVDMAELQHQEQEKNRMFQREERLGAQDFQRQEAATQRDFSKGMFDTEMDFKNRVQADQNFWAALDYKLSEKSNDMNAMIAMGQLDRSSADVQRFRNQASELGFGSKVAMPGVPTQSEFDALIRRFQQFSPKGAQLMAGGRDRIYG